MISMVHVKEHMLPLLQVALLLPPPTTQQQRRRVVPVQMSQRAAATVAIVALPVAAAVSRPTARVPSPHRFYGSLRVLCRPLLSCCARLMRKLRRVASTA